MGREKNDSLLLLGVGAALMYLFDPLSGRRRRALLHDQWVHSSRKLQEAKRVALVDAAHRFTGLKARAEHLIRHDDEEVDDAILADRVRAAMGRYVSHPHAIEVSADHGRVVLKGVVLEDELLPLLRCVEKVRGVKAVENRLVAYPEPDSIPSLQGGKTRRGPRGEWLQRNWSPTARLTAGMAGAVLAATGWRRGGVRGVLFGSIGAWLVARAATNGRVAGIVGLGECRGILIQKTLHVRAPVPQVFQYWRNFENFPQWMSHVIEVREAGPGKYHWIVQGPAGLPVEWDSELVRVVDNQEMVWRSQAPSIVEHAGRVRFDPENSGTRVQVQLCYVPIGGIVGHAVAKAFGSDPKSEMDDDLMRLKTVIETGHAPRDAAARRLHHGPVH